MSAPVSVVMPHYNALGTISRSIESVISQTLAVGELIVVDDGSSDFSGLENLLDTYSDRLNIVLLRLNTNCGAACARNLGVEKSSFPYIAFLDSDDVWHPQKIAVQLGYMIEHPSVNLVAHLYIHNLDVHRFGEETGFVVKNVGRFNYVFGNPFYTPTVMVRRDSFVAFDSRFRRVDDYKCWYENLPQGEQKLLTIELAGGYKEAIGDSGLTGSVILMHRSYLRVLGALYSEGKMRGADFVFTIFFEFVKLPVRVLRVFLRRFL